MEKQKLERIVASLRRQRKQLATRIELYAMFTAQTATSNRFLKKLMGTLMHKGIQYRNYKQLLYRGN